MPCYHPLRAWRRPGGGAIVFSDDGSCIPLKLPCGQCIGCRLEYSRQWAIRCMHEAAMYDNNCFLTLTVDDEHMPPFGSLDKRAFPSFIRRLRKRFPYGLGNRERPIPIRYFHAGEYGANLGRPHYHACVFGFDFADKVEWTRRSNTPVWRSATLEALWPQGLSEIGSVTFESAAYVARYMLKKVRGPEAEEHYVTVSEDTGELGRRQPEYTTMSRRPGIGVPWLRKYMCEVYPADGVVVRGRLCKPPRFYDMQFELAEPLEMEGVRFEREGRRRREDETPCRLSVREAVARGRVQTFSGRRYEDGDM